jgi:tetratricopeptide (TPR) repeat protein
VQFIVRLYNFEDLITSFRRSMVVLLLAGSLLSWAQDAASEQQLAKEERWSELVERLAPMTSRSADQEFEYGMALAQLQRWDDARAALIRGSRLQPGHKRFPIELAGIAFKQKKTGRAVQYLHRALRLDPHDDYANEFLATIYFLRGNIEAAVKYWNRLGRPKPQLGELTADPPPHLRPAVLDHALAFSPASTLTLQQLRSTEARLRNLEVFSNWRVDLVARSDTRFDSVLRARELNGFGDSKVAAGLRVFRGLPFQEITPEYYNLGGTATNITSLGRWDPDKRRYTAAFSALLGSDPQWRYRLAAGFRNENWDLRNGFAGPAPILASLNLRREEMSAEIARLIGWRWRWSLGLELSHRDYRNVTPGSTLTPELLGHGFQLKQTALINYDLLRLPEHRFDLSTTASAQGARLWSQLDQSFARLQASLEVHWQPRARGDDLETLWRTSGGKTFGELPFDELIMLGLERDNDPALWMHAHIGTRHGRKGSAPLGRDYLVSNWESDKHIYGNGVVTFKLGPFLDSGKITDPDRALGSHKWLWDTGAVAKVRVLGVGAAFVYGKDLRTGNNAYYVTLAH